MSTDLLAGLAYVVVSFGGLALLMGVFLWLIVRSRPGRASVAGRADAFDGVVRVVRVRVDPGRSYMSGDRADRRLSEICIDVDTPDGPRRLRDRAVRPDDLPLRVRRQLFSAGMRWRDLNLNIDDDRARARAAELASAGGYDFQLREPLRVKVLLPRSAGQRLRWQLMR